MLGANRYVWGDGSFGVESTGLSIVRKAAVIGDLSCQEVEGEKWVEVWSQHARIVCKSHSPLAFT